MKLVTISAAAACVLLLEAGRPPVAQPQAGPAVPIDLGPEDPAYRQLFTPSSSPSGTFAVYRSADDIKSLAARLKALDPTPAPGAWIVERTGIFDAFGAEGPYDKSRLARLFRGSSPRAARGSLVTPQGRIAVALISPYPDLAITSLRQGTLVIVTRVQSAGGSTHREGASAGGVRLHHRGHRVQGENQISITGRAQSSGRDIKFSITGRPQSSGRESILNHREATEFREESIREPPRSPDLLL